MRAVQARASPSAGDLDSPTEAPLGLGQKPGNERPVLTKPAVSACCPPSSPEDAS